MIALIDYGAGNLRSVEKALRHVGADLQIVTGPEGLKEADAAVLPGVGAFDDCLQALRRQELAEPLRGHILDGKPFLGICVGYQALFERSEEFNSTSPGLGIFPGKVVRFPPSSGLKVPQIGWNQIEILQPGCPLFRNIRNGSYVYFVHSYYPVPVEPSLGAAVTDYGEKFVSVIWRKNIYATQFHPEKSQGIGLQLLRNFVDLLKKV